MAGSIEDTESATGFFQDMFARDLGDPLLVVSDGTLGIIKVMEACFPRSSRQRCLAHRLRNLAAKVLESIWPEFKARVKAVYHAPGRAMDRDFARGIVKDFEREHPTAVACFLDDFEARIAYPSMSANYHHAASPTSTSAIWELPS